MHVPERKWTIHTAVPGVTEPFDARVTGPTVWPSDEPVEVVEVVPAAERAVSRPKVELLDKHTRPWIAYADALEAEVERLRRVV